MTLNLLDIGIIFFLAVFLIAGMKTGVIREIVSLIGIIIVFILSFAFKGILGNFLCMVVPFIQFKGALEGISTMNILIFQTLAFLILFGIFLGIYTLLVKISKFIQKIVNMTIILIIPSKILGGIVSFIRGYIVIMIILMVLVVPFHSYAFFEDSLLANKILYKTPILSPYTESFVAPIGEVYELTNQVANKQIDANTANLKSLDIMLKYKIVSKAEVENLVRKRKLDDVKNIDSVLNKY